MEADEELNVMDVGAKWQSKKELYTILTTTGDLYLPPISYANQKYLREICMEVSSISNDLSWKLQKFPMLKDWKLRAYLALPPSMLTYRNISLNTNIKNNPAGNGYEIWSILWSTMSFKVMFRTNWANENLKWLKQKLKD